MTKIYVILIQHQSNRLLFFKGQWESNEMCVTLTFLFLDSLTPEIEADRSGGRTDAERTIQGGNLQKAINLDLAL